MAGFILGDFNRRVRLLFMLVIVIVLNEGRGNTRAQCIERERQALLRFKQSLVDPANLLSSWKSSDLSCCSWKRIRCDNRTNHIIMLDLHPEFIRCDNFRCFPSHSISGKIDSALVQLHYLRHLDISYNDFTRIPNFIGSFKRLRYLNFSGNPIIGTIPSQIRNLTRLQFLDLDFGYSNSAMNADNLEWLSYLPSLRSLTLGRTNFSKAVGWLQSIKTANSLSTLNLSECQFPEVDIWSLSQTNSSNSLRSLISTGNEIHTRAFPWLLNVSRNLVYLTLFNNYDPYSIGRLILPENSFRNLTSLEYVDLWGTEIEGGILKSWGNLCSLKTLYLSYNSLNGTLDDLLDSLKGCSVNSLEILSLTSNELRGLIPDMRRFMSLRKLYLDGNELEGPFPISLTQFPKLLSLKLDYNKLIGPLPDLSHMSSLTELSLSNNKLNNTLPESIGKLSNLNFLDLSSNSFTGVISEVHFQNLSSLEHLVLSSNDLILNVSTIWVPPFQLATMELSSCKLGPIFPRWLKTQFNLSTIGLSNSSIFDTIPNWFYNLTSKLIYLNLSSNHITGSLSNFPFNNAFPVDLSSNKIHGAIPTSLYNVSMLDVSNNSLTSFGLFPCSKVGEELALGALDLSNNMLFGRLPDCWWKLKDLAVLNLENNKLFGTIPSSMGCLNKISVLRLRNNHFSGGLPSSLANCTRLQYLDVGENNLTGKLPTWIGESITRLMILQLKGNKFQGSIPSNLCNLQYMQILDLSANNISGAIPSCIDNFTSMVEDVIVGLEGIGWGDKYIHSFTLVLSDALIMWKGVEHEEYAENMELLRLIDLSRNKLTGEIPKRLTNLVELIQLNLSRNYLTGSLPERIGQLNKLESLDLSHNQLSGAIPQSLATMSFLSKLNLSNNHLRGKIPTGPQLQTFDTSSYAGNPELCGQPLNIKCPGDEAGQDPSDSSGDESYNDANGEWFDMSWLRMGIEVGFAVGFCGVCGNLWLNKSWRLAYFRFFNNMGDWLYVRIIVKVAILKRRFSNVQEVHQ